MKVRVEARGKAGEARSIAGERSGKAGVKSGRGGAIAERLVRPLVRRLAPYVPGEQPSGRRWVKLNTNESPYPPSPKVLRAVRGAVDGRLRLYPSPTADGLRERLAGLYGCSTEQIIVGNGSDELLALSTRAFVEPLCGGKKHGGEGVSSKAVVQYFDPSYSLYPVLGAIHGAVCRGYPLDERFGLPPVRELARSEGREWDRGAGLTFVTTPNAPSGRGYGREELEALCRWHRGVLVLDEAYVDYADGNALSLALELPNVLVARTFSKGYSLCFQRVGYFVGPVELIGAMHKIRDSYNVNGLGQAAALATLGDLGYYRDCHRRIRASRDRLAAGLGELGFEVMPSQANFVLARPPLMKAHFWFEAFRERGILVRWFGLERVREFLRITVGTEQQVSALLRAARGIVLSHRVKFR